jgi:hypothetical protein
MGFNDSLMVHQHQTDVQGPTENASLAHDAGVFAPSFLFMGTK